MADAARVKTPRAGQQSSPEADPTHIKKQKRVKPKDAGEDKDSKDAQPKALTPKDAQPKAQPSPVSRRKLGVRSMGMACVHARALTLRPRSHTSRA